MPRVLFLDKNSIGVGGGGTIPPIPGWHKTGIIASGQNMATVAIDVVGLASRFGTRGEIDLSGYGLIDGHEYYMETTGGPYYGADVNNQTLEASWIMFGWSGPDIYNVDNFQMGHWGFSGRRIYLDQTGHPEYNRDDYFDQNNQQIHPWLPYDHEWEPGIEQQLFNRWVNTDGFNSFVTFIYHAPQEFLRGPMYIGSFADQISNNLYNPNNRVDWELGTAIFVP